MFVGNGEIVLFDGSFDLFGTGGRSFNRLGAFSSAVYTVFSKNFLGSLNLLWVIRVIGSPFCTPYTLVYVTFGNVLFLGYKPVDTGCDFVPFYLYSSFTAAEPAFIQIPFASCHVSYPVRPEPPVPYSFFRKSAFSLLEWG